MTDANTVSTPMDPNVKFNMEVKSQAGTEVEELPETNHGYRQLIRSLMYLTLATCPDISYMVNWLAQITSDPKPMHWTAVKRVF